MNQALQDLIEHRRTTNVFEPNHTISDEQIEHLVHLATRAPTSFNLQNWRFLETGKNRGYPNFASDVSCVPGCRGDSVARHSSFKTWSRLGVGDRLRGSHLDQDQVSLSSQPPVFPGLAVVGVVEIAAGIGVAIKPRIYAYVVAAWLVGIILNLLILPGYFDVALRDLGLALGALALGRLSQKYDHPWRRNS